MLLLEEMTMMEVVPSNSIPDGVLVGRRHNFYYKNSTLTMMTNLERKKKLSGKKLNFLGCISGAGTSLNFSCVLGMRAESLEPGKIFRC